MAIVLTEHQMYERRLARFHEQRSPQAGTSPVSSGAPVQSTDPTKPHDGLRELHHTINALAGVITVLGMVILVVAAYQVKAWRNKRRRRTDVIDSCSKSTEKGSSYDEEKGTRFGDDLKKPAQAALAPAVETIWTPNARAFRPPVSPMTGRPTQGPRQTLMVVNRVSTCSSGPPTPSDNTPPPRAKTQPSKFIPALTSLPTGKVYTSHPAQGNLVPSRIPTAPSPLKPSTILSPAPVTGRARCAYVAPLKVTPKAPQAAGGNASPAKPQKHAPRLMTVESAFEPAMPDELAVNIGETVRLLEEYGDGWCLVQHVSRTIVSKGVVPRACLEEHRGASNHRRGGPRAI